MQLLLCARGHGTTKNLDKVGAPPSPCRKHLQDFIDFPRRVTPALFQSDAVKLSLLTITLTYSNAILRHELWESTGPHGCRFLAQAAASQRSLRYGTHEGQHRQNVGERDRGLAVVRNCLRRDSGASHSDWQHHKRLCNSHDKFRNLTSSPRGEQPCSSHRCGRVNIPACEMMLVFFAYSKGRRFSQTPPSVARSRVLFLRVGIA